VRGNISTSGRFYVGISSNPSARIAEHRRGEGAEWTRRYPPCGVAKIKLASRDKGRARLEEDATVKRLMRKHGKENVRGGSYSRVQLTSTDNKALSKELNHAEGGCLRCGHQGHWASQCYAQRDVEGRSISSDGDTFDDDDNHAWGGCFRCGHQGHWASQCYAQRNVEGRSISSNGETFDDDDDDDTFDDDDPCESPHESTTGGARHGRELYTPYPRHTGPRGITPTHTRLVHHARFRHSVKPQTRRALDR